MHSNKNSALLAGILFAVCGSQGCRGAPTGFCNHMKMLSVMTRSHPIALC